MHLARWVDTFCRWYWFQLIEREVKYTTIYISAGISMQINKAGQVKSLCVYRAQELFLGILTQEVNPGALASPKTIHLPSWFQQNSKYMVRCWSKQHVMSMHGKAQYLHFKMYLVRGKKALKHSCTLLTLGIWQDGQSLWARWLVFNLKTWALLISQHIKHKIVR